MASATLITPEQYLNTSYEPDRDFVDGVPVERNVGTQAHSTLQGLVYLYLYELRRSHSIKAFVECRLRVKVAPARYRIPDVMAVEKPLQMGKVITDVPAIIVEIKSPDDTFDDILDRCFDYDQLGTPNILVLDPDHERAHIFEHGSLRLLTADSVALTLLSGLSLEFPLAKLFAKLHED